MSRNSRLSVCSEIFLKNLAPMSNIKCRHFQKILEVAFWIGLGSLSGTLWHQLLLKIGITSTSRSEDLFSHQNPTVRKEDMQTDFLEFFSCQNTQQNQFVSLWCSLFETRSGHRMVIFDLFYRIHVFQKFGYIFLY